MQLLNYFKNLIKPSLDLVPSKFYQFRFVPIFTKSNIRIEIQTYRICHMPFRYRRQG